MGAIEYFTNDHRMCAVRWVEVEAATEQDDFGALEAAWHEFDHQLRRHLGREEEILFPAFEAATDRGSGGPTEGLRTEHDRMRGLLHQMARALDRASPNELLDLGDALQMLIRQHHTEEEALLYPLIDRAMRSQWSAIRQRLRHCLR